MGAFLAEPEQNEKSQSFGVQITFDHIMRALDARIHPRLKTTYVELLQGRCKHHKMAGCNEAWK